MRFINRSYRIRGRVPRAHKKEKATNSVLKVKIISLENMAGPQHINKQAVNRLIIIIFMYSAIKIRAKVPLLYSVLNPDTSSDSPSAKSKGVRLVSASAVINQINIIRGRTKRIGVSCEVKIFCRPRDCKMRRGARSTNAILTS